MERRNKLPGDDHQSETIDFVEEWMQELSQLSQPFFEASPTAAANVTATTMALPDHNLVEPTPIHPNGIDTIVDRVTVDSLYEALLYTAGPLLMYFVQSMKDDLALYDSEEPKSPTNESNSGLIFQTNVQTGARLHQYSTSLDNKIGSTYHDGDKSDSIQDDEGGQTIASGSKRKRDSSTLAPSSSSKHHRPYTTWDESYKQLVAFHARHGHCILPATDSLGHWVKRQRYQYKLKYGDSTKSQKQTSTLTDTRQKKLEDIGFVWSTRDAIWEERFNELVEYKKQHGHCNVQTNDPNTTPTLSTWVRYQRQKYNKIIKAQHKNITDIETSSNAGDAVASAVDAGLAISTNIKSQSRSTSSNKECNETIIRRVARLKELGFNFDPRNLKRSPDE